MIIGNRLDSIEATGLTPLNRALAVTASPRWDLTKRFPLVVDRADKAYVWDVDGMRYVDLTSCSGAAPLGSGRPEVLAAIIEELGRTGGIACGTVSNTRTEVAERLIDIFPCAERAIFMRTGSCATTAAARLARVHTGRPLLLTSGYHGWHDWQLQYKRDMRVEGRDPQTADFGYDLDRLEGLLLRNKGQVAGVFVTPEVNFFPVEFMNEIQRLARHHGALFMIDEIITSFRYALGGLHKAAGLEPDLITVSKGIANGTALSAVLGAGKIMRAQEDTYVGNTFQRETTPFAAALATLEIMTRPETIPELHAIGEQVKSGLNNLFEAHDVAAVAFSHPAVFHVLFDDDALGHDFYLHLRGAGYLAEYGGTHMVSHAMTDEDIEGMLEFVREFLSARREAGGLSGTGWASHESKDWAPVKPFAARAFGATAETVDTWWAPPVLSGLA